MARDLSKQEVAFLKETKAKISYKQLNPKSTISKSWCRYESYKVAKTMEEYFTVAGTVNDFKYDFARGFVTLDDGEDAWKGFDQSSIVYGPTTTSRSNSASSTNSQFAEFDDKPRKKKRLRGPTRSVQLPIFTGNISPPSIELVDLNRPSCKELQMRCIKPNKPGILRNLCSEGALSLGSISVLRKALNEVLENEIEVAFKPHGNGMFYGDDTRREATSMKIGVFLDLLEQPIDINQEEVKRIEYDFYLIQCPFLNSDTSSDDPNLLPPPLAPLSQFLKPPSCIPRLKSFSSIHSPPSSSPTSHQQFEMDVNGNGFTRGNNGSIVDELHKDTATLSTDGIEGNFWACHRATVTSAHFDGRDNILLVIKGSKEVTLWSPSETRRHSTTSQVSASHAGVARAVTDSMNTKAVLEELAVENLSSTVMPPKVVTHVEWPSLSLLASTSSSSSSSSSCSVPSSLSASVPSPDPLKAGNNISEKAAINYIGRSSSNDNILNNISQNTKEGYKVTVTLYAGESLFIPEGWYHQVKSEAGTMAVNFWFGGTITPLIQEKPHAVPYLLKMLSNDLLAQSRASLVRACRSQSRLIGQPTTHKTGPFSSIEGLIKFLEQNLSSFVLSIAKHMTVSDMITLLPTLAISNHSKLLHALGCATPWAVECLTGTWTMAQESGLYDMNDFYDIFFNSFGDKADQVRNLLHQKQQEFGRRLMPLLFYEIGVFEPIVMSGGGGRESNDHKDMTEVRSLLTLLSDHQLFQGAGADHREQNTQTVATSS